jgi:hypothetical protein
LIVGSGRGVRWGMRRGSAAAASAVERVAAIAVACG